MEETATLAESLIILKIIFRCDNDIIVIFNKNIFRGSY